MAYNPNVNRTYATLRFFGSQLEPETITKMLRLNPSEYFKRGDKRGKDERITWPHGYWAIHTENEVDSTDLEAHIIWLLNKIESAPASFKELRSEGITVDIFCFWESLTGQGGPSFTAPILGRLAALELDLGLDIYFVD